MGQFLPADHSKGDANTLGGYTAVHGRPAAFEGADGSSYSVEIITDANAGSVGQFGAYLLFIRWRAGDPVASGHLETDYLSFGTTEPAAREAIERLKLAEVREYLNGLISAAANSRESSPLKGAQEADGR